MLIFPKNFAIITIFILTILGIAGIMFERNMSNFDDSREEQPL